MTKLRIWWIPQIPMQSFITPVEDLVEAKLLLDTLASYDQFQLDNNVKPDYSNAGGLHIFDPDDNYDGPEGSWVDWHDSEGEDIDYYTLEDLRKRKAAGNLPKWEGEA